MMTRPGTPTYNPAGPPSQGVAEKFDVGITSLSDLASVVTTNLLPGAIRQWVNAADGTYQVWQTALSSAATGDGIQRANDWAASGQVWFKKSS
jgi:hypothetical protein